MQKINQFNQYLLEKHPTLWNTKIIWMLMAGFVVHILFFIIGYFSHMDPVSLQKYSIKDDYFKSGVIFIHLIISILMIVGWLIMMFKNNAFKNFYPSSKWKLFSQFVQYFIIILVSITFYFPYMMGFRVFIDQEYPDAIVEKNKEVINRAYPFLSQSLELYTLENRKFPKPFDSVFCETDINKVDRTQKYFVYYNRVYQFYSVYPKTSYKKDSNDDYIVPEPEKSNKTAIAYSLQKEDAHVFYFKKEVVDLSSYIKTTGLSYYNFSDVLYINSIAKKQIIRGPEYDYEEDGGYKKVQGEISRKTSELLDRKDVKAVENLFSEFLKISKEYNIKNNLEAKSWAKMIYFPDHFEVKNFIKKYKPAFGETYDPNISGEYSEEMAVATDPVTVGADGTIVKDTVNIKAFNPEIDRQTAPQTYFKNHLTDHYYKTDDLKDLLSNVDSVKSEDFFSQNIHIYIWIAFLLSTFIFSFRMTGLRSLLFSIISAGVIALSVVLIFVLYSVSVRENAEFFMSYFGLCISLIILLIPLVMMKKAGKMVSSICMNISLNGFAFLVFLIFGIISFHQKVACNEINGLNDTYQKCNTIIEYLNFNLSYIILICGFLFVYFYTAVLQKWKAMPL